LLPVSKEARAEALVCLHPLYNTLPLVYINPLVDTLVWKYPLKFPEAELSLRTETMALVKSLAILPQVSCTYRPFLGLQVSQRSLTRFIKRLQSDPPSAHGAPVLRVNPLDNLEEVFTFLGGGILRATISDGSEKGWI